MDLTYHDAVTLGNHEFDYGLETLEKIVRRAKFPIIIISSNYDFSGTSLNNFIKPYLILKKDGAKIGVTAINIQPKELIAFGNYDAMYQIVISSSSIFPTFDGFVVLRRTKGHIDMCLQPDCSRFQVEFDSFKVFAQSQHACSSFS